MIYSSFSMAWDCSKRNSPFIFAIVTALKGPDLET
ncbi:hypothetical protein SAMN05444412_1105 [Rhodonellum ikkaensis]|uniref:Uncharacterized protein n=1 Tax=Rhodonellum ikkaensis TaxID=336829 RepID=A0A1H3RZP7_9BACT|nr:hypothetical protein SAMN05444412_1105 [Rhodonellum ikkaensis]